MSQQSEIPAPTISVLMPVYNGSRFINTTIGCLLRQTFPDFELIIYDDASTDESWSILQRLAATDPRIRLYRHEQNQGVFQTQKDLAALARGEFIAQQDQDDFSAPNRFEVQTKILHQHPDASGTVSNVWLIDEDGNPIGTTSIPLTPESLALAMRSNNVCYHSSLMMRHSAFTKTGGYSQDADHVADYDLMLRLLKIGPLIPSDKALATYGLSPGTVTYRDRATQVALAQDIRHRHYGTPKPAQVSFEPRSLEQARLQYHKEVGRMYLAKGNMTKARENFRRCVQINPTPANRLQLLLAHTPGSLLRMLKRLKNLNRPQNQSQETYFLPSPSTQP